MNESLIYTFSENDGGCVGPSAHVGHSKVDDALIGHDFPIFVPCLDESSEEVLVSGFMPTLLMSSNLARGPLDDVSSWPEKSQQGIFDSEVFVPFGKVADLRRRGH